MDLPTETDQVLEASSFNYHDIDRSVVILMGPLEVIANTVCGDNSVTDLSHPSPQLALTKSFMLPDLIQPREGFIL